MTDLSGKRFGKLTVLEKTDKRIGGSITWKCRCDCGNMIEVNTRDLNNGRVKSCGCLRKQRCNITGHRFGKLTVLSDEWIKGKRYCKCKCDCGNVITIRFDSLRSGASTSCGCIKTSEEHMSKVRDGRKIEDHTSPVFYKGTISKNSKTGLNGVTLLKNGKYYAYIGYKNRLYSLLVDNNVELCKKVRAEAEEAIKGRNFERWYYEFKGKNIK